MTEPVRFLQSLVETYSPSGEEAAIADILMEEMERHNVRCRKDNAGNVIGQFGSGSPGILLCGHMDTVPGRLDVRLGSSTLFGRGTVDAKSSLAALMLGGIAAVKDYPDNVHVTIVGVVEEETSTKGIKSLISEDPTFDYAIFGEPSGSRNVTIGYKGHLRTSIALKTKSVHSASPWLSKNSFDEALRFWTKLEREVFENYSESKFHALTGSVTHMFAGDATNTAPSSAILEMDVRVPPRLTLEQVINRIERFCEDFQSGTQDQTTVSASFRNSCPPFLEPTDSTCARAFGIAIRRVTGQQATLVKKTGTSDMNLLAEAYKIPMVAYGPGDSSLDHTDNEHVSIAEYLESIEVVRHTIHNLAKLHSTRKESTVEVMAH